LQSFLTPRTLAETPQVWQDFVRDTSTLVGNADNDVLRGFANQDLDGRQLGIFRLALLDDGLDRIAQKLTNDVFKMAQNVRKSRVEVAVDFDFGDVNVWAIGVLDQLLHRLAAIFDYLFCIAAQEDLAYGLLVVRMDLGLWEVPWRIESLGKCKMLFCNDASRDALHLLALLTGQ
jgi:hypothetical protein